MATCSGSGGGLRINLGHERRGISKSLLGLFDEISWKRWGATVQCMRLKSCEPKKKGGAAPQNGQWSHRVLHFFCPLIKICVHRYRLFSVLPPSLIELFFLYAFTRTETQVAI